MRKSRLADTIFIIIALSFASCDAPESNFSQKPPSFKLKIGYIPVADCSQLFIAIEKGYFDSRNLQIELTSMAGGSRILEALGAGALDIGFSNVVSLILARDAGLPFVALTGGPIQDDDHKEHALMVSPGSSVTRIADLEGGKIALNTRRNIDELMVTYLFKMNGMKVSPSQFVEVPFPRMLSALEKGEVDAIGAIEPYVTIGLASGTGKVLSYNYVAVQPVTEISTFVASEKWLRDNEEAAKAFSAAVREAAIFAKDNPSEVRSILGKYINIDQAYLQEVTLPGFTESLSRERLDNMIKLVHDLKWISSRFSADEVLSQYATTNQ